MELARIDHDDRRRVFAHVERRGVVDRDRIPEAVSLDPGAVRHHLAILARDGLVTVTDGEVRVSLEAGAVEEYALDGITFAIRPARQEDLAGIVGVIRTVVSAGTYVEAESVAQALDHEEVLLRLNQRESRMFFVATVEDEVIGWVHLQGSTLAKLAHTAELTVGLLPEYRGRGIGGRLLARALGWAKEQGYERIYQSVPATNPDAIGFLEHHGWREEARRPDHYRIDDVYVDEVMLAVEP